MILIDTHFLESPVELFHVDRSIREVFLCFCSPLSSVSPDVPQSSLSSTIDYHRLPSLLFVLTLLHTEDCSNDCSSLSLPIADAPLVKIVLGAKIDPDSIREGMDVYFECIIQANPWVTDVTWFFDGSVLGSDPSSGIIISNQSLVLQRVKKSSRGRYWCAASNAEGRGESDEFFLRVLCKYLGHYSLLWWYFLSFLFLSAICDLVAITEQFSSEWDNCLSLMCLETIESDRLFSSFIRYHISSLSPFSFIGLSISRIEENKEKRFPSSLIVFGHFLPLPPSFRVRRYRIHSSVVVYCSSSFNHQQSSPSSFRSFRSIILLRHETFSLFFSLPRRSRSQIILVNDEGHICVDSLSFEPSFPIKQMECVDCHHSIEGEGSSNLFSSSIHLIAFVYLLIMDKRSFILTLSLFVFISWFLLDH